MKVVQDDIWLCTDCLMAAVNDDYTGIYYHNDEPLAELRARDVREGLEALGPHLVPDFDSETGAGIDDFSISSCGCCHDSHHGPRHRFAVLG